MKPITTAVSGITVHDDGTVQGTEQTTLDFVGDGVVATVAGGTTTVTVAGSSAPGTHASTHATGAGDPLTGTLDATARQTVRKNTGADIGARRRLNLIEGTNITLTVADDPANEEVDVTVATLAGGTSGSTFALGNHTHAQLHDAVTVADTAGMDLVLTGQQISATPIFGTTGGTVAQGNDTRFHTHTATPVSVMDAAHGALGNGTGDDAPMFQSAINAVNAAGGGIVEVPPGRYVIATPVSVKSNVTLRGVNANTMGQAMTTGAGTIAAANWRHSVLLIRDRQGTDTYADGTFRLQGANPAIVGCVFYYDQQKTPLQRWMPLRRYAVGDRIEPLTVYNDTTHPWVGTGLIYEATTIEVAGVKQDTAATPPTFPTTEGTPVTESTGVVWTCRGTRAQAAEHYGQSWLTTHDTPYAYPATITLDSAASTKLPTVRNCFFANAYVAIAYDDSHNLLDISDCWISAYKRGIYVNNSGGIARISNVHIFPYSANVADIQYLEGAGDDDGTTGTENQTTNWLGWWTETNGYGAELKDALWVMLDRFFVYAMDVGLALTPASDGKSSNGSGTHCKFDHCTVAIEAERTNAAGWVFYGTHIHTNSVRSYLNRFSVRTKALTGTGVFDAIDLTFYGGFFNCGGGLREVTHQGGNLILDGILFGGVPNPSGDEIRMYAEGAGPDGTLVVSKCRFPKGDNAVPILVFNGTVAGNVTLIDNDFGTHTAATAITGTKPSDIILRDNRGYVTRKSGAATGKADNTDIAHGLSITPTRAQATCATEDISVAITSISATNLRVNLYDIVTGAIASGTHTVYWIAEA